MGKETGAFIGGAAAGVVGSALFNSKKVAAAGTDDELLNQIAGLNASIQQLIQAFGNLVESQPSGGNQITFFSRPPNPTKIMTQVIIPAVMGVAERLPDIVIPPDMQLVIKAQVTNFGLIRIGKTKTEAETANVAYAMIFNEAIAYKVANASCIWVANTLAGEGVHITVEQGG
jgi:hypothetical protein